MGTDVTSYILFGVVTGYMVYFIVKIKIAERKDFYIIDDDFLTGKNKKK